MNWVVLEVVGRSDGLGFLLIVFSGACDRGDPGPGIL